MAKTIKEFSFSKDLSTKPLKIGQERQILYANLTYGYKS